MQKSYLQKTQSKASLSPRREASPTLKAGEGVASSWNQIHMLTSLKVDFVDRGPQDISITGSKHSFQSPLGEGISPIQRALQE